MVAVQELNKVRNLLQRAPGFMSTKARTALLVKLHVLMQFEDLIEFQDLDEEVDENFRPTGWRRSDATDDGSPHGVEL